MQLAALDTSAASNQGTLVSALLGSAVTESDGDAEGIAVTAVDGAFGNWQFSLDGTRWQTLAPAGPTQAELLPASARVRFLPSGNYTGTVNDAITLLAWDEAVGTAGTLMDTTTGSAAAAFSPAVTASLAVYNSVQPAVVTISGPGTIAAGQSATFTVTLSRPSSQAVTVSWMPEDGTAVHPDDWTQGTFVSGYDVQTLIGYNVTAVKTGTYVDGYYYSASRGD